MNYQANAATQLSAWVTAILIVISLAFIVNIFVYIPAAALAGIIIEAAAGKGSATFGGRQRDCYQSLNTISMNSPLIHAKGLFNFEEWKKIWRLNKIDIIPFFVTFLLALRKSSWGLIFGLLVHLIILLGRYLFPVHREDSKGNVIYLQGELMFPSSDVSLKIS